MTSSPNDSRWMERALELARRGEGRTAPNPPVGAVVVRDGRIVGEGFHARAGEAHAEVVALEAAGDAARGSVVYVTLEPCAHHGRTPPCTEALIAADVAGIVIGCSDPNPHVQGGGATVLADAGISVREGPLGDDCRRLIAPFVHHVTTGMPFTTLKAAVTLDGKTATASGESQWISSEPARIETHRMRDRVDAIMVGIGTAVADNPRLTTRDVEGGRDPVRIVVDSSLRLPPDAAVLRVTSEAPTIIATTTAAPTAAADRIRTTGAEILAVDPDGHGRVDLRHLWAALGRRQIQHLLVEGGATLNHAVLHTGLVQRMVVVVCPRLIGGSDAPGVFDGPGVRSLADAARLRDMRVRPCGPDVIVEGEVE